MKTNFINKVIKKIFNLFGVKLIKSKTHNQLSAFYKQNLKEKTEVELCLKKILFLISNCTSSSSNKSKPDLEAFIHFCSDKLFKSKSQIFQDLFILYFLNEKKNGFFVDFGATNGVDLSNTFLLEKEYHWQGILAEPGKIWQTDLRKNRICLIDNRCVWSSTDDVLEFNETQVAELSTVSSFSDHDFLSSQRLSNSKYTVATISLNDLLSFHNAPYYIDYLSIDTEGSEYQILKSFDFEKYQIQIITVEHNFTPQRLLIFNLLKEKGYKRIFEKVSLFDDWYIKE